MSYDPNSPPVGGSDAWELWNPAREDAVFAEPEVSEAEPKVGGDIGPAGSIRDLTRQHGMLRPVCGLFSLDEAGKLWVPKDSTSLSANIEHGLRRPSLQEIISLIYWQAQQNLTPNPGDVETRKAVISDVISLIAPSSVMIFGRSSSAPRLDLFVPEAGGDFIRIHSRNGVNQHTRIFTDQETFTEIDGGRDMRWMAAMIPARNRGKLINVFQDGSNGKIGVYQTNGQEQYYDFLEDESRTLATLETYMGGIYYPGSNQETRPIDQNNSYFETIPIEQLRP